MMGLFGWPNNHSARRPLPLSLCYCLQKSKAKTRAHQTGTFPLTEYASS